MLTPVYFPWDISTASIVGAVGDDDAIKTSVATDDTNPAVYTSFNGALGGGPFTLTRNVTVKTSTSAATYNTTDPIVFTGTDLYGEVLTEELTLTAAGGNETVVGLKAFKTVTQIDVPVQSDTTGTFKFGVQDAFVTEQCVDLRVGTAGNLKVTHNNDAVDTFSMANGEHISISPKKIWGTSATTAQDIIVFIKK